MQKKQRRKNKNQTNFGRKWDESTKKISWKIKNRIRRQQIRESCGIQPINEWVKRRRRERDEHVTRMNAKGLVKISREIYLLEEDLQDLRKEDGAT